MSESDLPALSDKTAELIVRYLENDLSSEQVVRLRVQLVRDPACRALFVTLLMHRCGIARALARHQAGRRPGLACSNEDRALADLDYDDELVPFDEPQRDRRIGLSDAAVFPAIRDEAPAAVPAPGPLAPAIDPQPSGTRPSRLLGGPGRIAGAPGRIAAAVLLLIGTSVLVLRGFHPRSDVNKPGLVEAPAPSYVAALTAEVGAVWTVSPGGVGTGLPRETSLELRAGCAELRFTSGAHVVVEGPARFTVESADSILVDSGKAAANVPGGNFVVRTRTATVTDLGTEFGVEVQAGGATAVEVFKGRVQADPAGGAPGRRPPGTVLGAGEAARVSTAAVTRDPAGAMPQHFIRSLAQGPATLDVIDLVSGGDGAGQRRGIAIDAATGDAGPLAPVEHKTGDGKYHRVPSLPFVDGCFIPDGARGPVVVDSLGDTYAFPATMGKSFNHIWTGGRVPVLTGDDMVPTILGRVDYSMPGHGLIYMHANKALTLDLALVRWLYPRSTAARFRCVVNLVHPPEVPDVRADIYVLVDGKSRFEKRQFRMGQGPFHVDALLNTRDRFLTLAATDGGDGVKHNGTVWGDPIIELRGS